MSDPIPTTNAALLAAQAKAGQAGVDAYNAAKAELESRQTAAVDEARRSAIARGANPEAVQQAMNMVSTPYDQRIESLTQGGAQFEGAMARGDARMANYNAAVEASRGLIADQTAQAVAPINAQADFQVRRIDRSGEAEVNRINAQLALDMARLEAQARGRGGGGGGGRGGGGGGGTTLNATELRGMISPEAAAKVRNATQVASEAIEQGFKDRRDKVIGDRGTAVARADYAMRLGDEARDLKQIAQTGKVAVDQPYGSGQWMVDAPPDAPVAAAAAAQAASAARRAIPSGDVPGVVTGPQANTFETIVGQQALANLMASPNASLFAALMERDAPVMSYDPALRMLGEAATPQGYSEPSAAETMRNALMLAAGDLADAGYRFDYPTLSAAIDADSGYEYGDTAADVLNRSVGRPDVQEQQEQYVEALAEADLQAERARDDARKTQEEIDEYVNEIEAARREEDEARQANTFLQLTGVPTSAVTHYDHDQLITAVSGENGTLFVQRQAQLADTVSNVSGARETVARYDAGDDAIDDDTYDQAVNYLAWAESNPTYMWLYNEEYPELFVDPASFDDPAGRIHLAILDKWLNAVGE